MPPLPALKAFDSAARSERFALAADERQISMFAISHHSRRLEDYLGARLLDQTGSGAPLIEVGARCFGDFHPAIERIREAPVRLRGAGQRRRVTPITLPNVVNSWLILNWASSEASCPDIDPQRLTEARLVDLDRERVDFALRFGHQAWSGVVISWRFPEQLIRMCVPEYLPNKLFGDAAVTLTRLRLIYSGCRKKRWTVTQVNLNDYNNLGR